MKSYKVFEQFDGDWWAIEAENYTDVFRQIKERLDKQYVGISCPEGERVDHCFEIHSSTGGLLGFEYCPVTKYESVYEFPSVMCSVDGVKHAVTLLDTYPNTDMARIMLSNKNILRVSANSIEYGS